MAWLPDIEREPHRLDVLLDEWMAGQRDRIQPDEAPPEADFVTVTEPRKVSYPQESGGTAA